MTVKGGAGDDTFHCALAYDIFQYESGDGNDVILGYAAVDTINITDDSSYSTAVSGSDVIIRVGDGSMLLKDAVGKTLNIIGGIFEEGNIMITNTSSSAVVNGTSGNDEIRNTGASYVVINAGDGDDLIKNDDISHWTSIDAGAGNDTIDNDTSSYVTMNGGDGNDSIKANYSNSAAVIGGKGNDTISLTGSYSGGTINYASGDGDDVIYYTALNAPIINITDGANYYTTKSVNDVLIHVGTGTLTVKNVTYGNVTVVGGNYSTAVSGTSINNTTYRKTLVGTAGNDTIYNSAYWVTIDAGEGDDSIFSSSPYGSVNAGAGDDTIHTDSNHMTIDAGAGNDTIYNTGDSVAVNADDGDDTITNYYGVRSTINGGLGNDVIRNNFSQAATVDGGAGNDSIVNYQSSYASINSGSGDDTINNNFSSYTTINGGTGDDYITNSGMYDVYNYGAGDGYDIIEGFDSSDTINITDDSTYSTAISGNDVIVNIGDDGLIMLKDAASLSINISGGTGETADSVLDISTAIPGTLISGTDGDDTIYSSGEEVTIDGNGGNDYVENYGMFSSLVGGDGNDSIYNWGENTTMQGDEGDDLLDNSGREVLMFGGNGNDTFNIVSKASVIAYGEAGNDVFNLIGGDGSTVYGGAGNDSFVTGSWNDEDATQYANSTYLDGGAGNDTLVNVFEIDNITMRGGAGNDYIKNDGTHTKVYGDAGSDTIEFGEGDMTVEYSEGDGDDVIVNFNPTDDFSIASGYHNLIHLNDVSISGSALSATNVIVTVGSGTMTFKNARGKAIHFLDADGTQVIRAFGNSSVSTGIDNVSIETSNRLDSVESFGNNVTINTGEGNDTIWLMGTNTTLDAGAGNDNIYASGQSLSIDAGDGNDAIFSNFSSDGNYITVHGGKGDDLIDLPSLGNGVIQYASGDGIDNVSGYNADYVLSIGNATYSTQRGNDGMLLVSIGSGYINLGTYSGGVININGSLVDIDNGDADADTDTDTDADTDSDSDHGITTVNSDDEVRIVGTNYGDSIVNNGDNVTVVSGGGNDTLTGSNYGEMYLFSAFDGNNIITNFGRNDSIQLTSGSISGGSVSGNNYIITIKGASSNSIVTLRGAGKYTFHQSDTLLTAEEAGITLRATVDGQKLSGKSGGDYLYNTAFENVTIEGNGGNDTLTGSDLYGEMFLFASSDGNNIITNFGQNDTIKITSGAIGAIDKNGDDAILSFKDTDNKVTLGGAGKYDIKTSGNLITVNYINYATVGSDGEKFTGTSGRDYITNTRSNVTIQPGKGNDTIDSSADEAEMFVFAYNSGKNVITDFGKGDTLKASSGTLSTTTSGDDVAVTITKSGTSSTITLQGAAGKRLIQSGNFLTVDSTNYVEVTKKNKKYSGTSGNDYITNPGYANVTIQPGKGNDTIDSSEDDSELFIFAYNSGDNVITDFGKNDTLKASSGTMTYATLGNDAIVSITKSGTTAKITLQGAANTHLVQSGSLITVDSTNYIEATVDGQKVVGTSGADYITNDGFERVTIQPGKGNDTIEGSADDGEVFAFAYNSGKNVITNFGKNDTLRSTSGTITTLKSGNNMIVTITKSDTSATVTLQGTGDYKFKKSGSYLTVVPDVNTIDNGDDGKKIAGTAGKDLIMNSGQYVTIDGNGGDDTIIGSEYGETFLFDAIDGNDTIVDFDANDVLRIMSGTIQSAAASGNDYVISVAKGDSVGTVTLKDISAAKMRRKGDAFVLDGGANKILNSADTVQLTGTDFNDSIINTGNNVTINGGQGDDTIDGSSYGEMIMFGADGGHDLVTNFGKNDTLRITFGAIQSTMRAGNDVIVDVKSALYSGAITLGGAAGYAFNRDGNDLTVENVTYKVNRDDNKKVTGTSKAEYITNSGANVTIAGSKGNDTMEGSNFGELYTFAYTHGNNVITNFGANDSLKMTSGKTMKYSTVDDDVIVTLASGSSKSTITLKNAAQYSFETLSGNVLKVKSVNSIVNTEDGEKLTGSSGRDYIVNTGEHVTIQSNKGNDTIEGSDEYGDLFLFAYTHGNNLITNFGKNDTLKSTSGTLSYAIDGEDAIVSITKSGKTATVTLAGAGDYAFNNKSNVLTVLSVNEIDNDYDNYKVVGTSGRDYITNSGENVSIQSGKGNDTIEGSVFGETFLFAYTHGSNVITNFGVNDTIKSTSGTLTYQKSGSDMIVSITKSGTTSKTTLQCAGGYTFAQDGNTLYVDGVNEIVNDEDKKKITGTSGKDYIINTGERVTIASGKGNDTIVGSDEYGELYTFAYNHGKNVIKNFGAGDTLKATSGTLSYTQVDDDYVVSIKKSSTTAKITLEGAAANGTLQKNTSGDAVVLRTASVIEQLPASAEDYWFTAEDSSSDELGELINDAELDNALAQIASADDFSIGSARLDQITAIAKHQSKK